MMRVISSPSSSTTGFFTLILAMRFPAISGSAAPLGARRCGATARCVAPSSPLRARECPSSTSPTSRSRPPTSNGASPRCIPKGRKYVVVAAAVALLFLLHCDFARLAAGRPDDLGRGLLPRSDPDDAERREADRRARRRAGHDDRQRAAAARTARPGGLADADYTRVSIFMSVFDVHINRTPIAGTSQARRLYSRQVPQRRPRQGERG